MLFNSLEFIMIFFPVACGGYFFFGGFYPTISRYWLLLMSILFYSWWDVSSLPILIISILFNYLLGMYLIKNKKNMQKIFYFGIIFNVSILLFYKYTNFFIDNLKILFNYPIKFTAVSLPLAISFFTFHQIIYLFDCYKKNSLNKENFVDYCLYICFFPQLIAGPLVKYSEIVHQFKDKKNKRFIFKNFNKGLFVFSLGLFKKVVLADSLSIFVHNGFDTNLPLNFIEGWLTSISYTLQLYYDFSGYSDMALGLALMLNIKLPINFFSPYKALNIQDFWRRWHMTLGQFFKDYVYIPIGGKDTKITLMSRNIIITFFLTGFWHGADWLFIIWGLIHGFALIFYNITKKYLFFMSKRLSWFFTFLFINFTWVFFRAHSFEDVKKILKAMVDISNIKFPLSIKPFLNNIFSPLSINLQYGNELHQLQGDLKFIFIFITALVAALFFRNTNELLKDFNPTLFNLFIIVSFFSFSILRLHRNSEFIYFNF